LSDGALALEQLAAWIEPVREDRADGTAAQRLLAMGEAVSHLARRLDERWRGLNRAASSSAALLSLPGMLDEYAQLRGLDAGGELGSRARERFDRCVSIAEPERLALEEARPEEQAKASPPLRRALGQVRLIASGTLRDALGSAADLELQLPCSVEDVLSVACDRRPAARSALFDGARLRAAVYRGGERLGASDVVRTGDCLDLALVISGG